jgi:hypothetical protein
LLSIASSCVSLSLTGLFFPLLEPAHDGFHSIRSCDVLNHPVGSPTVARPLKQFTSHPEPPTDAPESPSFVQRGSRGFSP